MRLALMRLCAALAAVLAVPTFAAAAADIRIDDDHVFPESLSAARDGSIYVGSMKGIVYRAPPGGEVAKAFIRPSAENGILALLGVLADDRSGTLWLCSSPTPFRNPPAVGISALMAFDLKTGKQKGAWPFPAPASACNDITVGKDGTAYATDIPNGRIFVLKPGADALKLYASDARLKGIDGIVFSSDGILYVNVVSRNVLVRIDRKPDGSYAGITELKLSQPVAGPDGFRLIRGNQFLLAEGGSGKIDRVTITGDEAKIEVLREGLISPPGVTRIGPVAYGLEGKIGYLIDPKLRDQDPGPFVIHAIPLP